jgi:hypothetical protein
VPRRPCRGGPYDGLDATARPDAFAWIDGQGRAHALPGPGRWLYRRRGAAWEFGGHGARRCGGCGGVLAPDPGTGDALPACPCCGA